MIDDHNFELPPPDFERIQRELDQISVEADQKLKEAFSSEASAPLRESYQRLRRDPNMAHEALLEILDWPTSPETRAAIYEENERLFRKQRERQHKRRCWLLRVFSWT